MAGGNLGDLQFTLGVNDQTSKDLRSILSLLDKIDAKGEKSSQSMELISKVVKGLAGSTQEAGIAWGKVSLEVDALAKKIRGLERIKGLLDKDDGAYKQVLTQRIKTLTTLMEHYQSVMRSLQQYHPGGNKVPFFNEGGARDLQKTYGQAFDALGKQADELRAKIDKTLAYAAMRQGEITAQMRGLSPGLDGLQYNGKKLSARDQSAYDALGAELSRINTQQSAELDTLNGKYASLQRQMEGLVTLSERLAAQTERMQNATYKPYTTSEKEEAQARLQRTNELKRAMLERMEEEKRAQAVAKQAEAEQAAAAKRLQSNVESARRSYERLFDVLNALRHVRAEGNVLGLDVSKVDAQIAELRAALHGLRSDMAEARRQGTLSPMAGEGYHNTGLTDREQTLARRVVQEQQRLNEEKRKSVAEEEKHAQAVSRTAAAVRQRLVRAFEEARGAAGKTSGAMQDLKGLLLQGGIVYGAQQFLRSVIETGGQLEQQHIALQTILGDMQNANTLYGQIQELALNSPFTFSELNKDVKQLAAYGVEYNNLYDTTKRLADMSSGLGVSFERIALAFGQVQARGWLDGKELRQIAYAGIPLLDKLSKYYSQREGRKVTTSDVKSRISSRGVDFEDVKNVFWEMTDAGGQFYNMQQTLSETLLGRWNKLKDAWEIMLSDFASGKSVIGGTLMTAINGVTALVQGMHTLAPLVTAALGGFALKKLGTVLGGGVGSGYLATKASIAGEAQKKLMLGKQLTAIEQRILLTKGRITQEELTQLVTTRTLTKLDVQRLRVSGQITAAQYRQTLALLKQQGGAMTLGMQWKRLLVTMRSASLGGMWQNFATSATAAFGVVRAGAARLVTALWAAIGGLPGLIISVVSMGLMKLWSDYEELTSRMEQTADELKDRVKTLGEFLRDNPIEVAIKTKDDKAIANLIENYKEELKSLSGADYDSMEHEGSKKASRAAELEYLKERVELLKKASELSAAKLENRSTYRELENRLKYAKESMSYYMKTRAAALRQGASDAEKRAYADASYGLVNRVGMTKSATQHVTDYLKLVFKDVSKNPESLAAAEQMMESIMSELKFGDEEKNMFRAGVLDALGVRDRWLEGEVGQTMSELIDKTSATIGAKIRNGQELTDAERAKVRELMKDAEAGLVQKYGHLSGRIKSLLAQDKFELVIDLVLGKTAVQSQLEREMMRGIPAGSKRYADYAAKSQQLAKGGSSYAARNQIKQEVDDALNELESRKSSGFSKAYIAEAQRAYDDAVDYAEKLLHYTYKGEKKKSNKEKKDTGHKEDAALKDLRERVELYKKMYGEIEKYKRLFGAGALGQLAGDGEFGAIFGDKGRFPLSDYTDYKKSLDELLRGLPGSTQERRDYKAGVRADIQGEKRRALEESRRAELDTLNKQLDVIEEQYATYKKLYELTGNKRGAENVAFGGTVQSDSYKKHLEEMLNVAVLGDNVQSGLSYSGSAVAGMPLKDVKERYGEDSKTYLYRERLENEQNRLKKESIDLLAELIEKNATISQQIEDENLRYARQKELIEQIEDPALRARASAGNDKGHEEKVAGLRFEQFKQETDWVTIFDDLDRVSSGVIDSMVGKIDDFSRTTGLSVEAVKQLRDALEKLRGEQTSRNPVPYIFGRVREGNAIGSYIKRVFGDEKDGSATTYIDKKNARKMGLSAGMYSLNGLKSAQRGAYSDSSKAISSLSDKMNALSGVMQPVVNLFAALGDEDSVLGKITGGAQNALSSAAGVAGNINTLSQMKGLEFLEGAGPYAAAAAAGLSIGGTLLKAFGADYTSYNKAKGEYENLVDVWDKLISKKKEYLSENWGDEARRAADEAARLYASEIAATQELARKRLSSGASIGSHSIGYRMWKGSYKDSEGRTWSDVAKSIEQARGVRFEGMEDLLSMSREDLEWIMQNYPTLWAHMDGDFREQLEKLMEIRESVDDLGDEMTEKLTGMKFGTLVENWAAAMTQMSNSADDLVDSVEDGLKKAILNSMVQNLFGDKIKSLIAKTKALGENSDKITDAATGATMSEYTGGEYSSIMSDTEKLAKEIEAVRDMLKKTYGWSDSSASSSRNSVESITEEQADTVLSYLNALRLDVSVGREQRESIMGYLAGVPEMGVVAKSQLSQLVMIAENTQRSAEAAEAVEEILRSVTTQGRKKVYVG